MFETLRDEIVNDEMLAGQPESSKAWVKEVRGRGRRRPGPGGPAAAAARGAAAGAPCAGCNLTAGLPTHPPPTQLLHR